jgi:hypothetical protein
MGLFWANRAAAPILLGQPNAVFLAAKAEAVDRIYRDESYADPADLGGWTRNYWEAMRLQTDSVPGLGACGARWLVKMLTQVRMPSQLGHL